MLMYAKLFASLYQGTLRGCSDEILVFTNLLAHADALGRVDIHWRAISEETGLPQDRVRTAIERLESPDPDSRSPEEGGRRIMRLDEHRAWGWIVVNHGKYRAIRSEDDRREQNRLSQERWRNKNKPRKPESAQAEAEVIKTLSDKSDDAPVKEKAKTTAMEVLDYLNLKAKKSYRYVKANTDLISARLKEGATVDECKRVIDNQIALWSMKDGMSQFMRPKTLFNATNFANYIGSLPAPTVPGKSYLDQQREAGANV